MKKSAALALGLAQMALMMGMEPGMETPRKPTPRKPHTPFKEQEGVVNIIKEFKLIQNGKSTKGKRKQVRTITKINEWLDKGYLTKEDINL